MRGKITVVGSYNTGFLAYVDRLPVEGETLPGHSFRIEHGGKGSNQAIQAARLGCDTEIIARIGSDIFGDRAVEKWAAEHVGCSYVVRDAEKPTGAGLVIVGPQGRNMIVVDLGANMRLSKNDVERASSRLSNSDVVLAQLEIPLETALHALRSCEAVSILNPAPAPLIYPSQLEGVKIITPNEVEILTMAGYKPSQSAEIVRVAERYARYVEYVVVTLGEKGALVVGGGRRMNVKTPRVRAVDSTGAGDAFNGALAAFLARGYDLLDAVEMACCAGAFLAARVKRGELVEALAKAGELEKFIAEQSHTLGHVGERTPSR
jgi:ribokinase